MNTTNVALSDHETFLLLSGALVPIVGYLFNYFAESQLEAAAGWIAKAVRTTLSDAGKKVFAEAIKAMVQVAAAAGWGVIYTAVITGGHGMQIFKGAGAAIVSALFAHKLLWVPSNVNVVLGAQPSSSAVVETSRAEAASPILPLTRNDLFV